ncbi:unnamed protein product [Rhizopus stolonifer]
MSLFESTPRKRYPVEFNAGKCIVEGNTVKPDLRKGKIYMDQFEDSLLHFCWKERDGNQPENDIVVFPGDATFIRITACTTGRVYLLKLNHSNERHLYWMQAKSEEKDTENVNSVNALIGETEQDIDMSTELDENASHDEIMQENVLEFLQNMSRSRERRPQTEEPKRTQQPTQPDYGQLAQMLTPQTETSTAAPSGEPVSYQQQYRPIALGDVLNTHTLAPLLNDSLCESLLPYLPEDTEPSLDQVRQVVSSPQFSQALHSLTVALETGQLGPLLAQLGLDPTGYGVESFLKAIENQAQNKKNAMEE